MRGSVLTGLEEPIGVLVGTLLAITCTLGLVMGSNLFDLGSAIPPISDTPAAADALAATAPQTSQAPPSGPSPLRKEIPGTPESGDVSSTQKSNTDSISKSAVASESRPSNAAPDDMANAPDEIHEAVESLLAEYAATPTLSASPRRRPGTSIDVTAEAPIAADTGQSHMVPGLWALIHYANDETESAANTVARKLRAQGISEVKIVRVPFAVSFNQIRFFHGATEPEARRLAQELTDQDGVLGDFGHLSSLSPADFTNFRPQPRDGLIEIWIGRP